MTDTGRVDARAEFSMTDPGEVDARAKLSMIIRGRNNGMYDKEGRESGIVDFSIPGSAHNNEMLLFQKFHSFNKSIKSAHRFHTFKIFIHQFTIVFPAQLLIILFFPLKIFRCNPVFRPNGKRNH